MTMHQGIEDTVLITVDTASQVASAAVNGTVVDMQGWTGCAFVFNVGAMVAGATLDARVMQSNTSTFTVNSNVNAVITQVVNTSNTNHVILDVRRPTQRFLKTVQTPATANTTYGVMAVRYGRTGLLPPTQTALEIVRVVAN